MDKVFKELIFSDDASDNWLFKKYYYSGSNSRYWTFQASLNLLAQRTKNPIIVETGCQRQKDDIGAGMSTSIFGEYCKRYGGKLYTVDLIEAHLNVCKGCTATYSKNIEYILSDSIAWLREAHSVVADLLYLDSWDHPYEEMLEHYGYQQNKEKAVNIINSMTQEQVLQQHGDLLEGCQKHCLNEFKVAEQSGKINSKSIILIDDNQLPGGGKSRLVKDYLINSNYYCLLDLQQSLWIKEL